MEGVCECGSCMGETVGDELHAIEGEVGQIALELAGRSNEPLLQPPDEPLSDRHAWRSPPSSPATSAGGT